LRLLARHLHVQDGCVEGLELQLEEELLVVELDGGIVLAAPVDDAGHLVLATQAAARTRSLQLARFGFDFDFHGYSRLLAGPRPDRRRLGPGLRRGDGTAPQGAVI